MAQNLLVTIKHRNESKLNGNLNYSGCNHFFGYYYFVISYRRFTPIKR